MSVLTLTFVWLAILGTGIAGCVVLRALGVAATYVRDLLHIGAGVWILGWPFWHGDVVIPSAIVAVVAITTAVLPLVADRNRAAARIVRSVTSSDEHWIGLVHYTASYALFTALGLSLAPFAAAVALWSLSLGDGIGGVIGRAWGAHRFRVRGAKQKSFEGSLAVFVAATAGALAARFMFDVDVSLVKLVWLGLVAAVAEALAPRGTDNLLIPIAVFTAAVLVT